MGCYVVGPSPLFAALTGPASVRVGVTSRAATVSECSLRAGALPMLHSSHITCKGLYVSTMLECGYGRGIRCCPIRQSPIHSGHLTHPTSQISSARIPIMVNSAPELWWHPMSLSLPTMLATLVCRRHPNDLAQPNFASPSLSCLPSVWSVSSRL